MRSSSGRHPSADLHFEVRLGQRFAPLRHRQVEAGVGGEDPAFEQEPDRGGRRFAEIEREAPGLGGDTLRAASTVAVGVDVVALEPRAS